MLQLSKKWWAALIVLFSLTGCAAIPQINQWQLVSLNLGMSPSEAIDKLGQPPRSEYSTSIDNKRYVFHSYNLNNGVAIYDYFLAFENGQLRYWGYIDDFKRHPDSKLNRAMDDVLAQIRNQAASPAKETKIPPSNR